MRAIRPAAALLLVPLAACGDGASSSGRAQVVAAFYPLAYAAERVAGGRAEIGNLTPAGVEPHDLELTPGQVGEIAGADLVLYLGGGFQPAVEEAAEGSEGAAVDVLEELGATGEDDPHVWLDPVEMAAIVRLTANELADMDPAGAAGYRRRADELTSELEALDSDFGSGLADCERRTVVVSHEAFGHLAARYDLIQIGIAGLEPEAEPAPGRLAEVAELVRANGITTIFFESLVSPRVAETIADETGATTAELDPLESEPESGDYITAMRANLDALRKALGCQ